MIYSAGILLWRYREPGLKEYLVVSPGGPLWTARYSWAPPKGQMEEGETPWEAAYREFSEETSIPLEGNEEDYTYEGLLKQRKDKSVHIFSRHYIPDVDLSLCRSNLFTWTDGYEYPEIGHYAWMTTSEIGDYGVKVYTELMKRIDERDY